MFFYQFTEFRSYRLTSSYCDHLNPSFAKNFLMTKDIHHPRLKYVFSYALAMSAAFLTFKCFYIFEGSSTFGIQTVGLNFGLLMFLWFLSFIHTQFIRRNLFMALVMPFLGLQIANLMLMITSTGTNILGYLGFVATSSILIFASYKARNYERQL